MAEGLDREDYEERRSAFVCVPCIALRFYLRIILSISISFLARRRSMAGIEKVWEDTRIQIIKGSWNDTAKTDTVKNSYHGLTLWTLLTTKDGKLEKAYYAL